MSNKVLISEENLTNIANAIREKNNTENVYKPSEMVEAIYNIQTGDPELEASFISVIDDTLGANVTKLPSEITEIGDNAFSDCTNLALTELPDGVTEIGYNAFYNCTNLALTELPSGVTSIGQSAFNDCSKLALTKLPSGITSISNSAFYGCSNLVSIELPAGVTSIMNQVFSSCSNLATIVFPNITSVPTLFTTNAFGSTPIASGTGYIYVPDTLVDSFKTDTNWSIYADQIKPLSNLNLQTIEISNENINIYNGRNIPINITYNGGQTSLYYPDQEGYILSVNGNATLDENVLILTDNAQIGDIITITVTSTYDNSISSTKELEVIYKESIISVNLNDGQWVDSKTVADNGNIIYKSDAGSYNINNGESTAILNIVGYTKVKLYIRSNAESKYDYTEAFQIDTKAVRGEGLFSTKGKQSATEYIECVYELDGNQHTIEIMYSKDNNGNKNDDRGYFYIGEVSL